MRQTSTLKLRNQLKGEESYDKGHQHGKNCMVNRHQVVKVRALRDIGCSTVPMFVKRMMSCIMKSNLAMVCNLTGKNGKEPFIKTPLFKALFDAAQMNTLTADCTEKDLEGTLRKWFTGARDREGKRESGKRKAERSVVRQPGAPTGY